MKTILYNPIFINPQAYYVFPRLTRWLRPDDDYKEPANYIGQIEVTIIAYGEIGYTEYFEHTNYIDFTNFSNSYVRISLFTRLGACVLGEWKIGAMESDRPYIEPEVLASLKAVVIVGDKTNQDKDRDTVANLVDASNPFVISNASYNLNSGYGLYAYDFTKWGLTKPPTTCIREADKFTLTYVGTKVGKGVCIIETTNTSTSTIHVSFKVKISGIQDDTEGYFSNANNQHILLTNGINSIEMDVLTGHWYGFNFVKKDGSILGNCNIVVEQIPEFQGAFITDGVNDLIMSTKTVKQMGITDEITVVSMIHQIKESAYNNRAYTNYINDNNGHFRNQVADTKTGIYGYTITGLNSTNASGSVVNNILGDKNDYEYDANTSVELGNAKYSVQNYIKSDGTASSLGSQIAWYWTVIANKVLTTDQINQVIAYYNLDRCVEPTVLYDVKRQGLSNDTPDSDWYLKDFSKNGFDMSLFNFAKKGNSGVGKYETELSDTRIWTQSRDVTSSPFSSSYNGLSGWIIFANTELTNSVDMPSFKIQVKGLSEGQELIYRYYDSTGQTDVYSMIKDGEYTLPADVRTAKPLTSNTSGFQVVKNDTNSITITQIPSHAGALYFDGVEDYGKVTGLPIYKDYTFIIDYERISYTSEGWGGAIVSKSPSANNGAFISMMANSAGLNKQLFSFGGVTAFIKDDLSRILFWQTKYKSENTELTVGEGIDGDTLWLGTLRDNDLRFFNGAIYSLMTFPYSLSEFLIERQLKKHKLGTLYPDMVEFRPVINSNVLLDAKPTFVIRGTSTYLNAGDYVPENSQIWVSIKMNNIADRITKFTVNGKTIDIPENAYSEVTLQYGFPFVIDKSPQKIGITIEQDENYVLFNPVITSNVEYHRLDFYLNNYQKIINIGDYIPKDAYLRANIYLNNNVDELTAFIFNGVNIGYRRSSVDDTAFNISHIYNYDSPQEVNITIDEYIRYEDIVQPYPVLLRFNDENGNEVSWGGKFRVGSTITRIGSAADSNLLPNIYNIFGLLLNDNQVTGSKVIVEKTMVFKAKSAYIFDNNEPNCILSPRLLRIPNSSYKILGYIPDISGHGNHGVIHNSAYAEGSGVNEDGSYQFDGVDDFITIPTTVGGKQVLMKVNWQSIAGTAILYDQRTNGGFAIFNRDFDTNENKVPAYRARNIGGSTYIDGILNEYIYASELKDITHNIVELCDPELNTGTLNPKIGSSFLNSNYAQMSLYDFMLFDNISTDDKIKELNEYVGIEGNT